jgi:hypothetical protein
MEEVALTIFVGSVHAQRFYVVPNTSSPLNSTAKSFRKTGYLLDDVAVILISTQDSEVN